MKKRIAKGQVLPEAIVIPDFYKAVGDMLPGAYGWTAVWVDRNNRAFAFADSAVRESQGEFWPHLIIRSKDGFSARLMSQRVQRLDADLSQSGTVVPVEWVEL